MKKLSHVQVMEVFLKLAGKNHPSPRNYTSLVRLDHELGLMSITNGYTLVTHPFKGDKTETVNHLGMVSETTHPKISDIIKEEFDISLEPFWFLEIVKSLGRRPAGGRDLFGFQVSGDKLVFTSDLKKSFFCPFIFKTEVVEISKKKLGVDTIQVSTEHTWMVIGMGDFKVYTVCKRERS